MTSFKQLFKQYERERNDNENKLIVRENNTNIKKFDPLYAPTNSTVKSLEEMKRNSTFDYTTSAYYLLEKLYSDNENVKHVCRTYANFVSNCVPNFSFETINDKDLNKNILQQILFYSNLFETPNEHETWLQLIRKIVSSLVLFGTAYLQIRYSRNGNVFSLHFIPSSTIRPVAYVDSTTHDVKFVYCQIAPNGYNSYKVNRVFTDEEIICFRRDNMFSLTYGLSEFTALFKNLRFDEQKSIYLNNYLKNSYSGGMIFEIKDTDKELVERNREELIEMLSGVENAGRNMILEGNIRLVTDGNKAKDFPLTQLAEINRNTIYATAGVPLTIAGIRSEQGKLNSELIQSEEKVFLRNVETYQSIIFDTLNNSLFKRILKIKDFKIVAGVNKHFNLKNAESIVETLLKVGCTINEAREKLGFSKLNDKNIGNMLIIGTNNGVIPLETFFNNLKLDSQRKELELENLKSQVEELKKTMKDETKVPSLKVSKDSIEIK